MTTTHTQNGPASPPESCTYEEFLAWADEDTLAEWVDGEIVMSSPAARKHQEIGGFLYHLVDLYCQQHDLGIVLLPPFQMKLARSGREPDLIFITKEHRDRLRETYLDGPADLVVEIVSPESARRDRIAKFDEYEEAGIPEYWLIDPERERARFYRLNAEGEYEQIRPDAQGIYASAALPGFRLPVAWLWNRPPVAEALRTLHLI